MVDVMLMQALVRAVPDDAALLIVGDGARSPNIELQAALNPAGGCSDL